MGLGECYWLVGGREGGEGLGWYTMMAGERVNDEKGH